MACPGGLSLLEVVLAMAILAGSVAVLSQLVGLGLRAAGQTRDLTRAHVLAESLMSEMTAGIVPPEPLSPTQIEPGWFASVILQPTIHQGIVQLIVLVEEDSQSRRAARYELCRWIRDPTLELPTEEAAPSGEDGPPSSAGDGGGGEGASDSPPPAGDGSTPAGDGAAAGRRGRGGDAGPGGGRGGGDAGPGGGGRNGRGGQAGRRGGQGGQGGQVGRGGRGGPAAGRGGGRGGQAGRGGARGSQNAGPGAGRGGAGRGGGARGTGGARGGGARGSGPGAPDQGGGPRR